MISGDLSTSNDHHRSNRRADDERARIERLAREAPLREVGIRVPAEPPPPRDIERFQSLLSGRDSSRSTEAEPQRTGASAESDAKPADSSGRDETRSRPNESPARGEVARRDGDGRNTGGTSRDVRADNNAMIDSEPLAADTMRSSEPAEAPRTPRAASPRSDGTSPRTDGAPGESDASVEGGDQRPQRADAPSGTKQALRHEQEAPAAVVVARNSRDSTSSASEKETKALDTVAVPTQISAEVTSLVQAHRLTLDAPQQAAMTGSTMAPALAELIEKHVKQMLVSATASSRLRAREVLLRMNDDALPGTDLWLSRTTGGWQLRADLRSRDAYDALLASSEDLIRRFADSSLGELTIEPVFHGAEAPLPQVPRQM